MTLGKPLDWLSDGGFGATGVFDEEEALGDRSKMSLTSPDMLTDSEDNLYSYRGMQAASRRFGLSEEIADELQVATETHL